MRRTLARQKRDVYMKLHTIVMDETPERVRGEIAEHIVDSGLTLLGKARGFDATSALVVFPDDGTLSVFQAIMEHADRTGVDIEDICAGLVASLKQPHGAPLLN